MSVFRHSAALQKLFVLALALLLNGSLSAQNSQTLGLEAEYFKVVDGLLDYTVPVISTEELVGALDTVLILDAREPGEFQISKIPGALYVGYNRFDPDLLTEIPKDTSIVVYCSVGYRSEKIAEKLERLGYSNVSNLFGGIFEWVNDQHDVVTEDGPTREVHPYNRKWGQWISNPEISKVRER